MSRLTIRLRENARQARNRAFVRSVWGASSLLVLAASCAFLVGFLRGIS